MGARMVCRLLRARGAPVFLSKIPETDSFTTDELGRIVPELSPEAAGAMLRFFVKQGLLLRSRFTQLSRSRYELTETGLEMQAFLTDSDNWTAGKLPRRETRARMMGIGREQARRGLPCDLTWTNRRRHSHSRSQTSGRWRFYPLPHHGLFRPGGLGRFRNWSFDHRLFDRPARSFFEGRECFCETHGSKPPAIEVSGSAGPQVFN